MKKLIYFFMLVLAVFFVACDDDDSISPQKVSKVYRDKALKLVLNSEITSGKSVLFTTPDLKVSDITLINTIPGEDSLLIKGVNLEYIGNDVYSFVSKNETPDRQVSISGKMNLNGLLEINVTHNVLSAIVGKWKPKVDLWGLPPFPLEFNIVPANANDSIDMCGFLNYNKVSYERFNETIGQAFMLFFSMGMKVNIDFANDGQLTVSWKPVMAEVMPLPEGQSGHGMVRYNTKGEYLYAAIALDSIIMDATKPKIGTKSEIEPTLNDTLALIPLAMTAYKGLPFKYSISDDDLDVWVDRNMMEPYFEPIIRLFNPVLRNLDMGSEAEGMGFSGPILANLTAELARVFKESKSFEMHFKFERITGDESFHNEVSLTKREFIERLKSIQKNEIN